MLFLYQAEPLCQTYGGKKSSDGRLQGEESITTVQCDQNANTCVIHVPAPGFALVFLTNTDNPQVDDSKTYSTTAYTQTYNTIRADPSAVAISNGQSGKDREELGSTSHGSKNGATSVSTSLTAVGLVAIAVVGMIVS